MKKNLLLTTLALLLAGLTRVQAQTVTFYDQGAIQDIALTFTQSNWDYQLDTATVGHDTYIKAAQCVINGVTFLNVGVKYKGNSSYNANQVKNPLHIALDEFVSTQSYQNFTDVKLSNVYNDPSFVREVVSYDILRNYMDGPRSNFARVTINGTYYGLMTNVESISKSFVANHFYVSGNAFFKCNPINGGGPNSSVFPDLRYLGTSQASYNGGYELKSTTGWNELIHLCDTLNNTTAALPNVLDVDRAIWMLAFNNVLVNLDSYSGGFRQNYYLYRDADHRFNPIVWDLNMSFGGFQMLTTSTTLDTTGMKTMIPGANATLATFPLIQKIWNTPQWKRMYIAHLKTIAADLTGTTRLTQMQQMQSLIAPAVQADNNKFYTYAQFQSNLTGPVTGTGGNNPGGPGGGGGRSVIPGVFRLLKGRLAYLATTSEFTAVAPIIATPTTTPAAPALNDTVWVRAAVGRNNSLVLSSVLLGYRYDHTRKFNRVSMFDDGHHHDGTAGDGTYGAGVVARALQTEYYVYAENANAGLFSPQRAEHEFYSFAATTPLPTAGQVVVNELLADNVAGQTTAAGKHEDWIELYNTTASPIGLTGLYLTDDPTTHNKWAFPSGTTIAAGGYLIVWADDIASTSTELHANFKLSKSGEYVILSNGTRAKLDSVGFAAQTTDRTWGRLPNGTGPWQQLTPTFNAKNALTLATTSTSAATTTALYPNPADAAVTISSADRGDIVLYSAVGQVVRRQPQPSGTAPTTLSTADLPPGIYYVRVGQDAGSKLVVTH